MVTLQCAFTIAQGKVTILTHLEVYFAVCYGKSTRQIDLILAIFSVFFLVYGPKTHIYHNKHHMQFYTYNDTHYRHCIYITIDISQNTYISHEIHIQVQSIQVQSI